MDNRTIIDALKNKISNPPHAFLGSWKKRMNPYLQLWILSGVLIFTGGRATAQMMDKPMELSAKDRVENTAPRIGFADPDIRYPAYWEKAGAYHNDDGAISGLLEVGETYSLTGWKGERVFMQLLVQAKDSISSCRVKAGGLKRVQDKVAGTGVKDPARQTDKDGIAATAIKVGYIRYVLSNGIGKSGSGCGIDTSVQHLSHIVADGIDYTGGQGVSPGKNQPIWVGIQVPAHAAAGRYTGKLQVMYEGPNGKAHQKELTYQLQVKNHRLPAPRDWSFHLDLWQYPEAVARWYQVTAWSKAHFDKMRPYMQWLASAGQKVITAGIINDPWNGQTYDAYPSMVKWTRHQDGSWSYDYRIFDKWVQFMMDLGIDEQINCYSMVPWHNTFSYFDEASGQEKKLVATPGTEAYDVFWKSMLEDFARHLMAKGWFEKTCIAMDERPLQAMQKVIGMIKGLPHPFKLSLAGSYHKELDQEIYDYSITTRESYDADVLERRLAAGLPTTYYTCCTEDHPNTFSFSAPAEAAFIPLLSAARHLTGYLRWAYNAWPERPLTDSRFGSWSSGDTYLVYPGPGSSIRFEQLIRGIQDFEKISLLSAAFKAADNPAAQQQLDRALSECTVANLRNRGAGTLVKAVEAVLHQY